MERWTLKRQENSEYSNIMKIRAHHLLCIQGFQGYGYNRDFERNMADVIRIMEANPEQILEIVAECDVICSYCPHQENGSCTQTPDSDNRIKNMDTNVMKMIDLKEGTRIKAKIISSLIKRKSKNIYDVQKICSDCLWREKCLLFIQ
jgi:hypothetical protein